jgi:hypothetical protein
VKLPVAPSDGTGVDSRAQFQRLIRGIHNSGDFQNIS